MPELLVKWMQRCPTWRYGIEICAIATEKKPHHHPLELVWRRQLRQADSSLFFDLMGAFVQLCNLNHKRHPRPRALVWRSRVRRADDSLIFGLMEHLHVTLQFEPKSVTLVLER
jgi:hypothetical protein